MAGGPRQLCAVALPATTLTDMYTASLDAVISTIVVCNRGSTSTAFRLSHAVGGAADAYGQYYAYDLPILPNTMVPFTMGICLTAGDVLRGYAGNANLTVTAWGEEQGVNGDMGASFFLELADTPASYTGEAGKAVLVNPTEDGLIFSTVETAASAPVDAAFIVAATNAVLTGERVLTNTATVTWDFTTPGQAKATAVGAPSGTANTVAIFDGTGALTSDPLFVYSPTHKFGLGLTSPAWKLHAAEAVTLDVPDFTTYYLAYLDTAITLAKNSDIFTNALGINYMLNLGGFTNSSTVTRGIEVYMDVQNGTLNTLTALYLSFNIGATVTAIRGLHIPELYPDGTVTTFTGIAIDNATFAYPNVFGLVSAMAYGAGTNKWNIYASGTAPNLFTGGVTLGNAALTTDGTLRYTGTDFQGRKAGAWVSLIVPEALSIATGMLAADAVTYAKIQNVTDNRLLGRSAGSAGDVHEVTIGTGLSLAAGVLTSTVTKTFRLGHTWAMAGDVTTYTTLPSMFIPLVAGQTGVLYGVRVKLGSGTSVGVQVRRNGGNVGSVITVTTTAATTTLGNVALADTDDITFVLSAPVGTPTNLSMTLIVDYAA